MVLSSDNLTFISSETHFHCPYVSRTQTSSPLSLEVSCSLSLRRCLLKAGWSVRVYEENPAPFCSRKRAISSLPATQTTLLTPLLHDSLFTVPEMDTVLNQYLPPVMFQHFYSYTWLNIFLKCAFVLQLFSI